MSKYLSLKFEGSAQNIINFLKSKGITFESKQIDDDEIYLKLGEEGAEEIQFLKGTQIDESNDRIQDVNKNNFI
jgi:hypothetical protein